MKAELISRLIEHSWSPFTYYGSTTIQKELASMGLVEKVEDPGEHWSLSKWRITPRGSQHVANLTTIFLPAPPPPAPTEEDSEVLSVFLVSRNGLDPEWVVAAASHLEAMSHITTDPVVLEDDRLHADLLEGVFSHRPGVLLREKPLKVRWGASWPGDLRVDLKGEADREAIRAAVMSQPPYTVDELCTGKPDKAASPFDTTLAEAEHRAVVREARRKDMQALFGSDTWPEGLGNSSPGKPNRAVDPLDAALALLDVLAGDPASQERVKDFRKEHGL